MPLLLQHSAPSYRWGIWQTTESAEELLRLLPSEGEKYRQELSRFASPVRRQEWFAVRVLLYAMLGEEKAIDYLPNGRPFLRDGSFSISISHTKGYAAVLLGMPDRLTGIDIERYGDRVCRVASKFMRADEPLCRYRDTELWSLLLHWSAKETLFKCLDTSEVDFREHLRILPFEITDGEGSFMAVEYRTTAQREFSIHYLLHPDFVLTWSV